MHNLHASNHLNDFLTTNKLKLRIRRKACLVIKKKNNKIMNLSLPFTQLNSFKSKIVKIIFKKLYYF